MSKNTTVVQITFDACHFHWVDECIRADGCRDCGQHKTFSTIFSLKIAEHKILVTLWLQLMFVRHKRKKDEKKYIKLRN